MDLSMTADLTALKAKFDQERQRLLDEGHVGKWAVVTQEGVLAVLNDYQDAYMKASAEAPGDEYLIQQVLPEDPVETVQLVHWS